MEGKQLDFDEVEDGGDDEGESEEAARRAAKEDLDKEAYQR